MKGEKNIMSKLMIEALSTAFVLLSKDLSVEQARSQLEKGQYGIVLKHKDPIALITVDDLKAPAPSLLNANLPPTAIIGDDMSMQQFVDSGLITLFEFGAHGAVVLDASKRVRGILPIEAIDAYLSIGSYQPAFDTRLGPAAADAALGGSRITPKGKVICATCKYVNTVAYLDEDYLPRCQNPDVEPHTLTLS